MVKKRIVLTIMIALLCVFAINGHHMVCIDATAIPLKPYNENAIKCTYHYLYDTGDRQAYRCYIKFDTHYGISIVTETSLNPGDLGSIVVKSDIFGVQIPSKTETIKTQVATTSSTGRTIEVQKKVTIETLPIERFTASSLGQPLAIKFKPFIMDSYSVNRLFKRNRGSENLSLDELKSLIGPAIIADTVEDLIKKLNEDKIKNCTVDLPSKKF